MDSFVPSQFPRLRLKFISAMAIERCRIWLPCQRLQLEQDSSPVALVLFGWVFTGTSSLDAVVYAAVPQDQILRAFATLDALQVDILISFSI